MKTIKISFFIPVKLQSCPLTILQERTIPAYSLIRSRTHNKSLLLILATVIFYSFTSIKSFTYFCCIYDLLTLLFHIFYLFTHYLPVNSLQQKNRFAADDRKSPSRRQ